MSADRSGWLVSPAFDGTFLIGPAALGLVLAFALPEGAELGFAGWLLLVVFVDVAHVWASLFRTYLDPAERRRRPALYTLTPLGAFAGASVVHSVSPAWFWTILAYIAVLHFVRQQVGFAALYRVRAGLPTRSGEARVERALIYALTGYPLLWWHVHLPRRFEWFLEGDFLVGAPPWLLLPAGALTAVLAAWHGVLRVRAGRPLAGADLWILATAAVWFGGIVVRDGDLAFTATNVLLHGVPYVALVGWVGRRQWEQTGAGPARAAWFRGAGWGLFVGLLLFLGFAEAAAWESLVWFDHPLDLLGTREGWSAVAVPILVVPQLTHYVLDGFIWKLPSNPTLARVVSRP